MIEVVKIFNRVFFKQIKTAVNKIEVSDFNSSCKNNLCEAGEMLTYCIKMFNKEKATVVLPLLRNIFDMTLKAIVIDKNETVLKSYNDVGKKHTEDKDGSSSIRAIIGGAFEEYFSGITYDEFLKKYTGKGLLTNVYDLMCMYSHVTKTSEFVYAIKKVKKLNKVFCDYLVLTILYPLIIIYFDAAYTKLYDEVLVGEMYLLYMIAVSKGLLSLSNRLDFPELESFNKKFWGEQYDDTIKKASLDKDFIQEYMKMIQDEVEIEDIQLKEKIDLFYKSVINKYLSYLEIKIINTIK